jgi:hypothetical protein
MAFALARATRTDVDHVVPKLAKHALRLGLCDLAEECASSDPRLRELVVAKMATEDIRAFYDRKRMDTTEEYETRAVNA